MSIDCLKVSLTRVSGHRFQYPRDESSSFRNCHPPAFSGTLGRRQLPERQSCHHIDPMMGAVSGWPGKHGNALTFKPDHLHPPKWRNQRHVISPCLSIGGMCTRIRWWVYWLIGARVVGRGRAGPGRPYLVHHFYSRYCSYLTKSLVVNACTNMTPCSRWVSPFTHPLHAYLQSRRVCSCRYCPVLA